MAHVYTYFDISVGEEKRELTFCPLHEWFAITCRPAAAAIVALRRATLSMLPNKRVLLHFFIL